MVLLLHKRFKLRVAILLPPIIFTPMRLNAFATTGMLVGLLLATSCTNDATLAVSSVNSAPIDVHDSSLEPDPAAEAMIEPYRNRLEAEMNEVLNTSDMVMEKAQPEGLLGNFVADLTLQRAQADYSSLDNHGPDFCLLNHGGLRTTLPAGDITKGKVFELMPFENQLVVITLSGEATQELFLYLAKAGGHPIAGATMGIYDTMPMDPTVQGVALDTERTYKVVTSDYLANGGDKMSFFLNPLNREALDVKLRDAIIEHIAAEKAANRTLTATIEGRISYVD